MEETDMIIAYRLLGRKLEGKRLLQRSRHTGEVNKCHA
jgi:hypothetical protein